MSSDPLFIGYGLSLAFECYAHEPTSENAFLIASELGQSRLFGVSLTPEMDGRLTPMMAKQTVESMEAALPQWEESIKRLLVTN